MTIALDRRRPHARPAPPARHRDPGPAVAGADGAPPGRRRSRCRLGPAGVHRARGRRRARRRRRQLADRPRLGDRRGRGRATPRRTSWRASASRSSASPTPVSWSPPTRATWRCARSWRGSRPATTPSGRRCSTPAPRRWRTPSRSPGTSTGRPAVVAFDHAYHGRTNLTMALTAKNMPYKQGFGPFAPEVYRMPMAYPYRWPPARSNCGPRRSPPAIDVDRHAGGRRERGLRGDRADPGRGRVRRARAGLPGRAGRVLPAQRHRVRRGRDPDRVRPHRRLVRLRARGRRAGPGDHRQGHRRRPAAGRRDRSGRDRWTPCTRGGLGGTYGGNPVACAAALGAIRTIEEQDLAGPPAGSGR